MGHSELQIDQQARQPFWMPFSPNKEFKQEPRLFVRAQGLYCYTPDGREVIYAWDTKDSRFRAIRSVQGMSAFMASPDSALRAWSMVSPAR